MKHVLLFLEFYRKTIVAFLFLFVFMICSIFFFNQFISRLQYITYTTQLFERSGLQDSVLFMPSGSMLEDNDSQEALERQNFPAVRDILRPASFFVTFQGVHYNGDVCDATYVDSFRLVDEGQWFDEREAPKDGPIEVVVSGESFGQFQVGDSIILNGWSADKSRTEIEAVIIGKKNRPSYFLSCNQSSDMLTAADNFSFGHTSILITEASANRLLQEGKIRIPPTRDVNYFIRFQEFASEGERAQVLAYLEENGSLFTREQLLENSYAQIWRTIRLSLPVPFLMMLISTFSMLSISVLAITRKLKDIKFYYLCGCSKKRSYLLVLCAIGGLVFLAGGVNILYVIFYTDITNLIQDVSMLYFIMTDSNIYTILLYCLVTTVLSVSIPFGILRKASPIELYKR